MRTLLFLLALLAASGASAQSDAALLGQAMGEANARAAEAGMIAFDEAKLAFSDGFTSTHLLDLEADVEYMIVVATGTRRELRPRLFGRQLRHERHGER